LSRVAAQELEAGSKTRSLNWYYWAAAACVLIICGVFFYSSFDQQPSYAEFAIHEPLALGERSASDSVVIKAEESFNNKDYQQALSYFDQLLESDQENSELQLYKGIVLLELNRFDEAERVFKSVQDSNSVFKTRALWYLALSKLKQNRFEECRNIAAQIPEGSDEYDNAQELLERLD
jgi:tetratricopeptide (TPR) repeat protein